MAKVLLTGMSGTGKSTLVEELAQVGFTTVDVDEPAWSETSADGDWVWREDRVAELLDTKEAEWLFVSGCAENQVKFHHRFDAIVLLSAPKEIVLQRLATRTNDDYGKRPEEVRDVLGYIDTVEPLLRRVAHYEIDTSVPLEAVLAELLRLVGAESAAGRLG